MNTVIAYNTSEGIIGLRWLVGRALQGYTDLEFRSVYGQGTIRSRSGSGSPPMRICNSLLFAPEAAPS